MSHYLRCIQLYCEILCPWSHQRTAVRSQRFQQLHQTCASVRDMIFNRGCHDANLRAELLEVRKVMTLDIMQVVQEFSSAGGVETVAYELQRAWEAAGVRSTVLTSVVGLTDRGRPTVRQILPGLMRIPTRGSWRYLGRVLVVPAFTFAATTVVRKQKQNAVVLSHGDTLDGDVCVIHAVNKASLRDKSSNGAFGWMFNPMHIWVSVRDKWMIGGLRYHRYVAVSSRIAEELSRYYAVPHDRIEIIPNGIDLNRFTPAAVDDVDVRKEFSIPPDAPLLLFVGHEFERKGLAFIVQALAMLPHVYLLVVGSDDPAPYRKMATAQTAERIRYAGPRSDMPRLYRAATAFVFPSSYKSFSLVCMEALACGTPILATMVGGIEEYLSRGVNGYPISRNAEDIARTLRLLLDDPDQLALLRQGARATAERYSWTRIAERYKELLDAVALEKERARA